MQLQPGQLYVYIHALDVVQVMLLLRIILLLMQLRVFYKLRYPKAYRITHEYMQHVQLQLQLLAILPSYIAILDQRYSASCGPDHDSRMSKKKKALLAARLDSLLQQTCMHGVISKYFYSHFEFTCQYIQVYLQLQPLFFRLATGGPLAAKWTIHGSHTWSGGPVVAGNQLRRDKSKKCQSQTQTRLGGLKRRLTNTGVNIRPIPPIQCPSMGPIVSVVTLHGRQHQLQKSRPVSLAQ